MINSFWKYGNPYERGDYVILIPIIPSDPWGEVRYGVDIAYFDGARFHGRSSGDVPPYCFFQPLPNIPREYVDQVYRAVMPDRYRHVEHNPFDMDAEARVV